MTACYQLVSPGRADRPDLRACHNIIVQLSQLYISVTRQYGLTVKPVCSGARPSSVPIFDLGI